MHFYTLFVYSFFFVFCSLTEVSSKGPHLAIKERDTEKHTQSVNRIHRWPAADRDGPLKKRLKNRGFKNLQREINIAKNLQR